MKLIVNILDKLLNKYWYYIFYFILYIKYEYY